MWKLLSVGKFYYMYTIYIFAMLEDNIVEGISGKRSQVTIWPFHYKFFHTAVHALLWIGLQTGKFKPAKFHGMWYIQRLPWQHFDMFQFPTLLVCFPWTQVDSLGSTMKEKYRDQHPTRTVVSVLSLWHQYMITYHVCGLWE